MPFVVRKIRNNNTYTVKNTVTGKVYSYHTTRSKALAQVRLMESLNPLDYLHSN